MNFIETADENLENGDVLRVMKDIHNLVGMVNFVETKGQCDESKKDCYSIAGRWPFKHSFDRMALFLWTWNKILNRSPNGVL